MEIFENLIYKGSGQRMSPFDLYLSGKFANLPLVIFAHGYKGYKDWGAWHLVAKAFVEAGFDFLKFNFSHNGGTVEQPIDFPDLEAFSDNTYSRELEDIEIITKLALSGIELNGQKKSWDKFALIGHSRGGGIVILHAANSSHVSHLATWASVADYGERFHFDMAAWKETGLTTVRNGRTKQDMPHKYSFYEDFIKNEEKLTIKTAAQKIEQPWLIAHGTNDESVGFDNAERLKEWSRSAQILPIEGGTHTFGTSHPWKEGTMSKPMRILVDETIKFFRVHKS